MRAYLSFVLLFSASYLVAQMPTVTEISNTSTGPGGIRTHIFEVGASVPENADYQLGVYSYVVHYISVLGDNDADVITNLITNLNNTTNAQWCSFSSCPPNGTNGFKPTAYPVSGYPNRIRVTLNHQNQFYGGVSYTPPPPPTPPNPWNGLGPSGVAYVMKKMPSSPDVWNVYDNPYNLTNPIAKIGNGQYVTALTGNAINGTLAISLPDPSASRTGYVRAGCGEAVYSPIYGQALITATSGIKVNKASGDAANPVSNLFMKQSASCNSPSCPVKVFPGQRFVVLDSAMRGAFWFYKIALAEGVAEQTEGYIPKAQCTYVSPVAGFLPTSIPSLAPGGIVKDAISAEIPWVASNADSVTLALWQGMTFVKKVKTIDNPIVLTGLSSNTTYRFVLIGHKNGYPSCFSNDIFFTTDASQQPTTTTFSYEEIGGNPGIEPNDLVQFTGEVVGEFANSNLTWEWKVNGVPEATGKIFDYTFPSIGTYNVQVCFGSYCSPITPVRVGTGMPYVQVQGLRFYADNINEFAPGTYELSSEQVFVRQVGGTYDGFRFDLPAGGVALLDSNAKKLNIDDAKAYVPYVKGQDKKLYEGKMNFSITGFNLQYKFGLGGALISKALEFAKLKLPALNVTVLDDGAAVSAGRIQLPTIVKKLSEPACDTFGTATGPWNNPTYQDSTSCSTATKVKASISGFTLRRSGFWLAAHIKITDIKVATLRIRRLEVDMDYQPYEKLYGGADVDFKMFGLEANALIRERKLDSLGLAINLQPHQAPIGTTGLSIYQIRGSVSNLQGFDNLPLTIRAGVTIGPFSPVDLSALFSINGDIAYKVGTSFEFYGRMRLWILASAEARLYIQRHRFEFWARICLLNIIEGRAKAVVYKPAVGRTQFYGVAGLQVRVPRKDDIDGWLLKKVIYMIFDEGQVLAEANVYACNDYVCGWAGIKLPIIKWVRVSGMLRWNASSTSMKSGLGLGLRKMTPEALAAIDSLWSGMRTTNTLDGLYRFQLDASTEKMLIEVKGQAGVLPTLSLVTANGDSIHAGNIANYPNVAMFDDVADGYLAYIVDYPKVGDYGLVLSGVDSMQISRINNLPSIHFKNVDNYPSAKSLMAYWSDSDVDDDAKIRIFLDTDKANADGIALLDEASEDNAMDLAYLTYGNQATGDYYLGATIQDSSGYAYSTYYDTPIRVITNGAPNAPSLSGITFDDKNIYGSFLKNNPEGMSYTLYYSTDPNGTVSYNSPSLGVVDTSLTFALGLTIKPGRSYNFALSCMDTFYRESAMSNIITVNYIANVENNEPYFVPNQNIPKTVVAGSAYNYTLQAVDADNEPLQYALIEAPYGMTINSSTGAISWTPDANAAGMAWVEVAVIDGSKAYDSLYFEITILGTYTKDADLRFNKNLFVNVGDEAIVSLRDLDLGTNNFQKDVASIRVYSESDMTGMTLSATETAPESREYAAFFTLGNTTGGGILQAAPGDTIWAEYFDATINQTIRTVAYFVTLTADFEMALDSCGKISSFNALCKGDNLRYSWNFGDGSTATGRKPKHIYSHAGPFTVTITATDPDGRSASASKVISIDCITLPTEIALTGATVSEGNLLTWEVAADDQTQSFHIERAKKGEDFAEIAAVAHTQSRQTWLDKDLQATTYSYRLRLVDVNGNGTYSNQIELSRAASATVRCYPNPVQATLNLAIESLSETPASIKIYDMKGSLVLETGAELSLGSNKVELPVTELQAGAYQVQIITDSESIMTQFVKE